MAAPVRWLLDDIGELAELGHAPWTDQRLVGVVDFPHLEFPPGSRWGIVPNAAAATLVEALLAMEPTIVATGAATRAAIPMRSSPSS